MNQRFNPTNQNRHMPRYSQHGPRNGHPEHPSWYPPQHQYNPNAMPFQPPYQQFPPYMNNFQFYPQQQQQNYQDADYYFNNNNHHPQYQHQQFQPHMTNVYGSSQHEQPAARQSQQEPAARPSQHEPAAAAGPSTSSTSLNSNSKNSGRSNKRFSRQRNTRTETTSTNHQQGANKTNNEEATATGGGGGENVKRPIRFSHQRNDHPTTTVGKEEEPADTKAAATDNKERKVKSKAQNSKATSSNHAKNHIKQNRMKMRNREDEHDQASTLCEQLIAGDYECTVCFTSVNPTHSIWNCSTCYNVFHIHCIKKWARSKASQEGSEEGWLCPICRSHNKQVPSVYYCFCGKMRNPVYRHGEIPHSCGDVCGRKRQSQYNCKHPCTDLCHPGPCPKCPAMITKKCRCGNMSVKERCNHQKDHVCTKICKKKLNCKQHTCKVVCCPGDCKECDVTVVQKCYCGKESREIRCGSDEFMSKIKETKSGKGSYRCKKKCEKPLSCTFHKCASDCHPSDCETCPLSPQLVTTCPCTQTLIKNIKIDGKFVERLLCTDPIPVCGKICNKPLACGGDEIHLCKLPCHHGPCPPCESGQTSTICRCGKTTKSVPCSEYDENVEMVCDRRCNKKRKCGRHKCGVLCCVDKVHECGQICNKKLTCGNHRCENLCHRGKCHTCHNVSFDELSCYCGVQVTYPPIHCGTLPPTCTNVCTRMHNCTHPVRHCCHMEDNCPPCVELVKKTCNCGRIVRGNIMCHITNVSCGARCVKLLPCGHQCYKSCHTGECLEGEEVCKQACNKQRSECIHPCAQPCHDGQNCPTSICNANVVCKCSCGRIKKNIKCDVVIKMKRKAKAAANMRRMNSQDNHTKVLDIISPQNNDVLPCDNECHIQERNRRLAEALSISDKSRNADDIYSDFLLQSARKDPKFVTSVENELRSLVESVGWLEHKSKSYSFPNMKQEKRKVIHELAEIFRCKSQSYDDEPRRYVCVTAFKDQSVEPIRLLTQVVKERKTSKPNITSSSSLDERSLITSMKLVQLTSSTSTDNNLVNHKSSSSKLFQEPSEVDEPVLRDQPTLRDIPTHWDEPASRDQPSTSNTFNIQQDPSSRLIPLQLQHNNFNSGGGSTSTNGGAPSIDYFED